MGYVGSQGKFYERIETKRSSSGIITHYDSLHASAMMANFHSYDHKRLRLIATFSRLFTTSAADDSGPKKRKSDSDSFGKEL